MQNFSKQIFFQYLFFKYFNLNKKKSVEIKNLSWSFSNIFEIFLFCFRFMFWMDGPISLSFSLISIFNILLFLLLICSTSKISQKHIFHYLVINMSVWNIFNVIFFMVIIFKTLLYVY